MKQNIFPNILILMNDIPSSTSLESLISQLKQKFIADVVAANTQEKLETVRNTYLSRNGSISQLMTTLKDFSLEEKKTYGPMLNAFKQEAQETFNAKKEALDQQQFAQAEQKLTSFDVTAYSPELVKGSLHPYTQVIEAIEDIFISMGFEILDGPEVENDYHNFQALNIPENHPARDMQDTFWLTLPHMLMRTHTSSVEVHAMMNKKPPLAIAAPGRCYRNEATDASHDFMFMQAEGLFIDKHVSLANLFATVKQFLQAVFEKKDISLRVRPSYFPFVEPGVEIDMTCPFCDNGCSTCKKTKWIEICGAGMTHPNVLRACGINSDEYSGFAFGFGLTRLVMLKYGINDIRLLHGNRVDFLQQF